MNPQRRHAVSGILFLIASIASGASFAQKNYGPGVTDTEIKIGNTNPYSGPGSAFGIVGKVQEAYFKKINVEGGINGRKINFISYDDAYSPPKAVEHVRKLVEQDDVLMVFAPNGTPSNVAIQKYLNTKKVPQLFTVSGASRWDNPKEFPWTMGWLGSFYSEGRAYGQFIARTMPDAKIGVLYQNDDFGRDYLRGLKDGLGAKAAGLVVAEAGYEVSEPTMDSHMVKLKASGANVFANFSSPKFAAQAIRKMGETGWKPTHFMSSTSMSIENVIQPAGVDFAQDTITVAYLKDPTSPAWANDAGFKQFKDFMASAFPGRDKLDILEVLGYSVAQTLVEVLKRCGNDLTRENVMAQAESLRSLQLPMLLPGITLNTSATDHAPVQQFRFHRLKGTSWEGFGEIVDAGTSAR